jgi:hypothetical protein
VLPAHEEAGEKEDDHPESDEHDHGPIQDVEDPCREGAAVLGGKDATVEEEDGELHEAQRGEAECGQKPLTLHWIREHAPLVFMNGVMMR